MKVIVMNDAADVPLPDSDLDNRMEDSAPTEDNETITISDGVAEINQDNDNMDTQAFMRNRISDIETQIDHIKTTVRVYHQMRPVTQEDNVSKQMSDIIKKLKAEADDLRGKCGLSLLAGISKLNISNSNIKASSNVKTSKRKSNIEGSIEYMDSEGFRMPHKTAKQLRVEKIKDTLDIKNKFSILNDKESNEMILENNAGTASQDGEIQQANNP
ncbi:hypothetical protein X975_07315, partial [Stegodyphus mimosarum]